MANKDNITGFRVRSLPADLVAPFVPYHDAASGPVIDRTLQVFLPEVYPIPQATEFNVLASKSTAAVETVDIGLSVVLASNNIGVLRGVNLFITNMLTTTNLTWTVFFNDAPVPGYNNLSIFPRVAPFVGNSFDSFVRIPQGVTVKVKFSNIDGGAYTVGASLSGWQWPQTLGELWVRKGGAQ